MFVYESADSGQDLEVGVDSRFWHSTRVREVAWPGRNGIIGRDAYVGSSVVRDNTCKMQKYALIYEAPVVENGDIHWPHSRVHQRPSPSRRQIRLVDESR